MQPDQETRTCIVCGIMAKAREGDLEEGLLGLMILFTVGANIDAILEGVCSEHEEKMLALMKQATVHKGVLHVLPHEEEKNDGS